MAGRRPLCCACGVQHRNRDAERPIPEYAEPEDLPHCSPVRQRVCDKCVQRIRRLRVALQPPTKPECAAPRQPSERVQIARKSERAAHFSEFAVSDDAKALRSTTRAHSGSLLSGGTNGLSTLAPTLAVLEKLDAERPLDDGTFVDIGCSIGTVCLAVAKLFPNMRVIGIDYDDVLIQHARALAKEKGLDKRCTFFTRSADLLRPQWFVTNNVTHIYMMDRCFGDLVRENVFDNLADTPAELVGASSARHKSRWQWTQKGASVTVTLVASASSVNMGVWSNEPTRVPTPFKEYVKPAKKRAKSVHRKEKRK